MQTNRAFFVSLRQGAYGYIPAPVCLEDTTIGRRVFARALENSVKAIEAGG
jgi:hypothetical protein